MQCPPSLSGGTFSTENSQQSLPPASFIPPLLYSTSTSNSIWQALTCSSRLSSRETDKRKALFLQILKVRISLFSVSHPLSLSLSTCIIQELLRCTSSSYQSLKQMILCQRVWNIFNTGHSPLLTIQHGFLKETKHLNEIMYQSQMMEIGNLAKPGTSNNTEED